MTGPVLQEIGHRARFGLKGPRAPQWLEERGIPVPSAPNSWASATSSTRREGGLRDTGSSNGAGGLRDAGSMYDDDLGLGAGEPEALDDLLVARLGSAEFFLEDASGGTRLTGIAPAAEAHPPGVYPVLRQDTALSLSGAGTEDVLVQVCNVNFSALVLEARPVIMTLMIGVAVLVVPEEMKGGPRYRIWCDPTFGHYFTETFGNIVIECGGSHRGVSG